MRRAALKIKNVRPSAGIEGGKVDIEGAGFNPEDSGVTQVLFGDTSARPLLLSRTRIIAEIPEDAGSGPVRVMVKNKSSNGFDFKLGRRLTNAVNPVDNPVFDKEGNLYVPFSGKRGETVPVSVYKIAPDGEATPFLSNIPNPTSIVLDPDGNFYISSRFEGTVYKATANADATIFARDLGVPTGLAIGPDKFLYVGDRSGRILKISPEGNVTVFAEIPESMVAFHLAFDADGNLLVSSPALTSYNHIGMIDRYGKLIPLYPGFGRPQGIAVNATGDIFVCEAKAGDSSIIRIAHTGETSTVLTGPVMVGLAFNAQGDMAVACPNAVYLVESNHFNL